MKPEDRINKYLSEKALVGDEIEELEEYYYMVEEGLDGMEKSLKNVDGAWKKEQQLFKKMKQLFKQSQLKKLL